MGAQCVTNSINNMKTITPTEEYCDILIAEEEAEQVHGALRGRGKAT